jgi:hypothetical protein
MSEGSNPLFERLLRALDHLQDLALRAGTMPCGMDSRAALDAVELGEQLRRLALPRRAGIAGGLDANRATPARSDRSRRYAARVSAAQERRSPLVWSGYAAFAWGLLFAAISFYWGLGGTLGLDTLGGTLGRLAMSHDPAIFAAVWLTGILKVGGAILALALVQPWGQRLPRRPLLLLGWAAAAVLTLYGGTLVTGEALVASRLVRPGTVEWKPLLWHLYLWDMSFLIWGVLFALATWQCTRTASRSR